MFQIIFYHLLFAFIVLKWPLYYKNLKVCFIQLCISKCARELQWHELIHCGSKLPRLFANVS